jgi:hypothetical protein
MELMELMELMGQVTLLNWRSQLCEILLTSVKV